MVRAVDKADAMLTLSSALKYRKPFTVYCIYQHGEQQPSWILGENGLKTLY